MFPTHLRAPALAALAIVLSLSLGACAPSSRTADQSAATGETFPLTISHALGETVIPAKPTRVATVAWSNQDIPLALGVLPVGFSEANYGVQDGSGVLPWVAEAVRALGATEAPLYRDAAGLDYEAISASDPDVILAAYSGLTQEEYDLLSQIAPVVAYPRKPWQTLWREQALINSQAMGMAAEGEALVRDLEALLAEKLAAWPDLQGKSAAFFYFIPTDFSQYYVYLPADPRAAFFEDLGLTHPASIQSFAQEFEGFSALLSSENVDALVDIDIIVAYGNQELLAALQADPLLGTIPAIKRGSVAFLENNSPLAAAVNPSALSLPAVIDQYLGLLGGAAALVD